MVLTQNYKDYRDAVVALLEEVCLFEYKKAVFDTAMQFASAIKDAAPEDYEKILTATAAVLLQQANERLSVLQKRRQEARKSMAEPPATLFDDLLGSLKEIIQKKEV